MSLYVNQVIQWCDDQGEIHLERLLWIDPSYTDAYLFDLQSPKAMPVWRRIADLENEIQPTDRQQLLP